MSAPAPQPLRVHADVEPPWFPRVLELVESFCGVACLRAPRAAAELVYGDAPAPAARLRIPVERGGLDALPPGEAPLDGPVFPYDALGRIRYWLEDEAHAGARALLDAHERLPAGASHQAALGILRRPIVNEVLLQLRRALSARLGLALGGPVEEGRCIVVLTHDVDDPIGPEACRPRLGAAWALARRGQPARAWGQARRALGAVRRRLRPGAPTRPRHWLFAELLQLEERYGVSSSYFFASLSRWHPEGDPLDVPYELAAPGFRALIARLEAQGSEAGIHLSYRSARSVEAMRRDVERFRLATGRAPCGSRHHYWHLGHPWWEAIAMHARVGLPYDMSLAFNARPGFRLGIGWPFHPWRPDTRARVETLQIPSLAMDGGFFYEDRCDPAQAREELRRLLAMMKRCACVCAFNWHLRTSVPDRNRFSDWGRGYVALLELLRDDPQVEVLTGGEVRRRFAARRAAIEGARIRAS